MKYKKVIFFFLPALILSLVLRFLQLSFTIETSTGFFKPEFANYGNYMTLIIFAFVILTSIFSLTTHRSPEHPPKSNIWLSISSFAVAAALLFEVFTEKFLLSTQLWQIILLKLFGLAAVAFFIIYGLQKFIIFYPANLFYIAPTAYLILKVICNFTAISPLALISDNLILMAASCSSLLFALQFAKLYCGAGNEFNFRKLLASGLAAIILCFTQSIPHLIINLANGFNYQHTSLTTNLSILFIGIFISAFIFSHFSHSNACE